MTNTFSSMTNEEYFKTINLDPETTKRINQLLDQVDYLALQVEDLQEKSYE